jgi:MFS transporter, BCD family, chlorophyll transporter
MSVISFQRLVPRIDWTRVSTRWLPFADVASADLPLSRLLRLSLFQVSVGMATVLMVGTLNRVMIVELGVAAAFVAAIVALPLLIAPLRALVGLKSDLHKSFLGWKRVPYLWMGTLLQFGGLAIMPFALVLLTGQTELQLWAGRIAAALAFVLTGLGAQTAQTAGLALATDLAAPEARPRVVALMYVMLLVGMTGCGLAFGALLADFSNTRLVQVVQGAAVLTVLLNGVALWKQEPRNSLRRAGQRAERPRWRAHWQQLTQREGGARAARLLVAVGLGTLAFNMQDVILEPYGGEILQLGVADTTLLTAFTAGGALLAFGLAARWLARGGDAMRVAAAGALCGLVAFAAIVFSHPLGAPMLFRSAAVLIGFGGGLFAVGTLTAAMNLDSGGMHGLVLGAWGAVQASCAGIAVAAGGALRDGIGHLALAGHLGEALQHPVTGYSAVYHLEWLLLFATLVAVGPLVRRPTRAAPSWPSPGATPAAFGLAEFPR